MPHDTLHINCLWLLNQNSKLNRKYKIASNVSHDPSTIYHHFPLPLLLAKVIGFPRVVEELVHYSPPWWVWPCRYCSWRLTLLCLLLL